MVFAIFAIGMLGFFVWGHHMFISGMSPYSAVAFSILTLSIGVPSAIKTFNWLGTLWGAKIRFTTPMLFAIGFVSVFVAGGITGLVLGQTSLDFFFHDTYFVTAHFHLVMGVASIFGMFAAIYFWFPKMFGRMMNETLGKKVSDNPCEATTIERTSATPPPHENFNGHVPVVYRGPYECSVPGAPNDYVMQTDPEGIEVSTRLGEISGNGGDGHRH